MIGRRLILCIVLSSLLLAFSSARAETNRFSVINFRPTPDGGEFFSLASSTSLYQLQWRLGTAGDFAYRPLDEKNTGRHIVDRYLAEHFYGAIGITDWLSFGFDMPVIWQDRFSDPDVAAAPFQNKLDMGDPRFQLKFRVLDKIYYPVGIAIVPFATAPLGKKDRFMGDAGVTGGGLFVIDTNIKNRLTLAFNAGAGYHKRIVWRNVDRNKLSILLGAGAAVNATDDLSFAVEGNVSTASNHAFTKRVDSPAEVDAGMKYNIGKSGFQVYVGGGAGIVRGAGAPSYRGFGGFAYKSTSERTITLDEERARYKTVTLQERQQQETQRIISLRDKCPKDPADFKPGVDDEGCPKYYELKDVADLVQECPTRPEDYDPLKHGVDCNKVYTLADNYSANDVSTVYAMSTVDLSEKCPVDPADFNPKVNDQGCPKYYELKDAAPLIAKCPADPKKFDPKIDDESCPKVYVLKDQYQEDNWMAIARLAKREAPASGGNVPCALGLVKGQCMVEGPAMRGGEIETRVPITFKFNSYEITDASAKALGELAVRLIANPDLGPIVIEGYADEIGTKVMNKVYSQKRAEAVKRYLHLHGVDISRLKVKWYGPTSKFGNYPQNRRVVFTLQQ